MTLNFQQDIWSTIEKYLSSLDKTMISSVSKDHILERTNIQKSRTIDLVARKGYKGIVKWCHQGKHKMNYRTYNVAAKSGNLKLMKFLEKNRCQRSLGKVLNSAARHGHLNILKWWATAQHFRAHDEALYEAAKYGQLRIVKWFFWSENARERNNKFEKVLDIVVQRRHDDILKWCIKYNCKMNKETLSSILKRGDYEIAKLCIKKYHYLLQDIASTMYAAEGNNLKVLKLWC